MPATITVGNTIGALFIGTVLSSIFYGVTWLQVYSYYNTHCSRDRWPLKSFVAFLMLVDSLNMVFVCHLTYHGVTTFGVFSDHRTYAMECSRCSLFCICSRSFCTALLRIQDLSSEQRFSISAGSNLRHLTDRIRYWDGVW